MGAFKTRGTSGLPESQSPERSWQSQLATARERLTDREATVRRLAGEFRTAVRLQIRRERFQGVLSQRFVVEGEIICELADTAEAMRRSGDLTALDAIAFYAAVECTPQPSETKETLLRIVADVDSVFAMGDCTPDIDVGALLIEARRLAFQSTTQYRVARDISKRTIISEAAKSALSVREFARKKLGVVLPPPKETLHRIVRAEAPTTSEALIKLGRVIFARDSKMMFDQKQLTEDDIALVFAWDPSLASKVAPMEGETVLALGIGASAEKNYHLGRLLSARHAEKVAESFYWLLSMNAQDVSILQLTPGETGWRSHDLTVDDYPVDVKNSRMSKINRETYSEHCVPVFKTLLRSEYRRDEVRIAGVFSPFLHPYEILDSANPFASQGTTVVLGETSDADVRELATMFSDDIEFVLSRSLGDPKQFLPPWFFSYPAKLYADSDAAKKECLQLPLNTMSQDDMLAFKGVPILLSAGAIGADSNLIADESLKRFVRHWEEKKSQPEHRLPVLFLTLLTWFLREMQTYTPGDPPFDPRKVADLLFVHTKKRPLGIHDPLSTVNSLLGILGALSASPARLSSFRTFRLSGSRILLAKESSAMPWTTLIAYCGSCARYPLVFGKNETCSCRHLVCECGFCNFHCAASERRQNMRPS